MPSCLHISSVFPLSLSWWTLFSLSSSQNLLTKLFISLLLSLTHGNNHGFFFWCQKLLQSIVLSLCSGCSFLLLLLLVKKKFRRSIHCRKEIFAWNYPEHWCEFNVWQNILVEASTMVIWCCESVMFLFFLNKNSSNLNCKNRSRFSN